MNGDYLGFGVGAHSHRGNRRWWNVRDLHAYLRGVADGSVEADAELLSDAIARAETMFLGRVLLKESRNVHFCTDTVVLVDTIYGRQLAEYVARGVVTRIDGRLRSLRRRELFADEIAVRFLEGEGS